jgi:hypothetical protein
MQNKQTKLLFENWRAFIKEEAKPEKVDPKQFPTKLTAVDKEKAKQQVKAGVPSVDKAPAEDDSISSFTANVEARKLKPTQKTMDYTTFVGIGVGMLVSGKAGGPLGGIISSDGYIMDGHHRWAGTLLANPDAKISGLGLKMPGQQLVGILNVITKGTLNKEKGNPGKDPFSSINPQETKKRILAAVQTPPINYDTKKPFFTPEQAKAAFQKLGGGDFDKGVDIMASRSTLITANMPPEQWAPDRPDMPQINKDELERVKTALARGEVDVNPPYGGAQPQVTKESKFDKLLTKIIREELNKLK